MFSCDSKSDFLLFLSSHRIFLTCLPAGRLPRSDPDDIRVWSSFIVPTVTGPLQLGKPQLCRVEVFHGPDAAAAVASVCSSAPLQKLSVLYGEAQVPEEVRVFVCDNYIITQ